MIDIFYLKCNKQAGKRYGSLAADTVHYNASDNHHPTKLPVKISPCMLRIFRTALAAVVTALMAHATGG